MQRATDVRVLLGLCIFMSLGLASGTVAFSSQSKNASASGSQAVTVTSTATATPIATPEPSATPPRLGTFVLTGSLLPVVSHDLGYKVSVPAWMKMSEAETLDLVRVISSYSFYQRTLTSDDFDIDVVPQSGKDLINAINHFLDKYPQDDGTILAKVMLGHVHNRIDRKRSEKLFTDDYEQAIKMMLGRHPERVRFILDDLLDMGMHVTHAQNIMLGNSGGEALVFAFQFDPAEPVSWVDSRVFSIVQDAGSRWRLRPLPTPIVDESEFTVAEISDVRDVDGDGQEEVVVRRETWFADRTEEQFYILAFRNGAWTNLLPIESIRDSVFWLEDLDHDGAQEIVVVYIDGVGLGAPTSVFMYQWDSATGTYTKSKPIKAQVCGYHAWAEAERLYHAGNWASAVPWYEEARRRWLTELKTPNPSCIRNEYEIDNRDILQTFAREQAIRVGGPDKNGVVDTEGVFDYVRITVAHFSETSTVTSTVKLNSKIDELYSCDTPSCSVMARYYAEAERIENYVSGASLVCNTSKAPADYGGYDQVTEHSTIIQPSTWTCTYNYPDSSKKTDISPIQVINVCQWNGHSFRFIGSRVIESYFSLDDYKRVDQVLESLRALPNAVDCSGD